MALPLHVLERLPAELARNVVRPDAPGPAGLALGGALEGLDSVLPDRGLLRGGVVELAVHGGAALATTIALAACRSVQAEAVARGGEPPWSAFVDPSATLWGPGVAAAGVRLDRLLVVRPPLEALTRVALRVVESQAFAVVVIDTMGVAGAGLDVALGSWPRIVRRLALAVEATESCLLLITDAKAPRTLPLPVAQRLELARPGEDELRVRVAKDRRGRVTSPRSVAWVRRSSRPLTKAGAVVPPAVARAANDAGAARRGER